MALLSLMHGGDRTVSRARQVHKTDPLPRAVCTCHRSWSAYDLGGGP
jgi:hypothetical protein